MKAATVSVIGRPSAGKSTLVNTITGMKVSLSDSDLILYLLDGKRKPGKEEETIAELANKAGVPIVAVLNKADILSDTEKEEGLSFLKEHFPNSAVLAASGMKDEGVDEILIELFRLAPDGELMYSEETYTDQDLEFRISEIIREKTISSLSEEMPHVVFVEIEDLEYDAENQHVWVRASINTERDGQKGIIVGKGGENIKRIRKESFKEIKRIFPGSSLTLDLRVKSEPGWRKNKKTLDKLFR